MSWVCPHCNTAAIVEKEDFSKAEFHLKSGKAIYQYSISGITCLNPNCAKASISLRITELTNFFGTLTPKEGTARGKQLIPSTEKERAKVYPEYIPAAIINDYREACAIAELSPKASATLARRCIQGMIRDFWAVKADTLNNEIKSIKDKVGEDVWDAIDGIRKVGNIGAHMEKDINLIIDVNPEEADLLIEMVEMLLDDWYVARHEKQQRLQKIKDVAAEKTKAKTLKN